MNKKTNKIIILSLIILLIMNILLIKFDFFVEIDSSVYYTISKLINNKLTILFKFFSFLVSKEMLIVYLLIILGYSIIKKKEWGISIFFYNNS